MTGLDPAQDKIIEIAVIITDKYLNPIDPEGGFERVIHCSEPKMQAMDRWCVEHHGAVLVPTSIALIISPGLQGASCHQRTRRQTWTNNCWHIFNALFVRTRASLLVIACTLTENSFVSSFQGYSIGSISESSVFVCATLQY
jgi:hypothetical protein